MSHSFSSAARALLLLVAPLAPVLLAAACSSTAKGDVACDGGTCEAKPVFITGALTATLVTNDAVYVAASCAIYAADKPPQNVRLLAHEQGACSVGFFARTSRGLYWSTKPLPPQHEKDKPASHGTLTWFPEDAMQPTVIDANLPNLGSIVAMGDTIYVAVDDGIRKLDAGGTTLERALATKRPYALRAHSGALYWHDGIDTIFSWRPGDAKPTTLVENAEVVETFGGSTDYVHTQEPFVVDASGIYWFKETLFSAGFLRHAPLAGGPAEKLAALSGVPVALAIDDDAVYWSEADSGIVPKNTTIKRSPKSALHTSSVITMVAGQAKGLHAMPEGLYIEASPSLLDYDVKKARFERYTGPLLLLPRGVLTAPPPP